jgi:hypothetical protein
MLLNGSRVHPILIKYEALFKVPARLEILAQLNAGIPQFSQVGKLLTVYPRSTPEAIRLASSMHAATRGLRAPEIPFDARYRKGSLLYYRYGNFRNSDGGVGSGGTIFDRAGRPHRDRRGAGYAIPRWIDDPFTKRPSKIVATGSAACLCLASSSLPTRLSVLPA